MSSKSSNTFKFRRNASIGAADAESDDEFLTDCFVDTGELATLRDCASPKRLVVGRTGVGKSAILRELKSTEQHVIVLAPEVLALNYLTNSTILRFFENLGVALDPFYSLLWRHIFTVELVRNKFRIENEAKKSEFLSWVSNVLQRDKAKQKALKYLEEWGAHFWEETEYRIKEFTTKLETDLSASFKGSVPGLDVTAGGTEKLTEEQKAEIVQRAQQIVSGVQIKDLHEVIRLLSEDVFDDPQEHYFILIDRLDENWIDERIRYKLLRALLEAVRAFQQIKNVKVVVALRHDLLDRVFRNTRDAGFQEEKYESLMLKLRWTGRDLERVLDRRVNKLIRDQYTTADVGIRDIMPNNIGRYQDPLQYILERTFFRPREAILFLNECLSHSEGKAEISARSIQSAEVEYSRKRLRSLADEWHADFPRLPDYTRILVRRRSTFTLGTITKEDIDAFSLSMLDGSGGPRDPVRVLSEDYLNDKITHEEFLNQLVRYLYQVGFVGIKPDAMTSVQWSYQNQPFMSSAQIGPEVHVYVHPTFWSVLGNIRD